MLVLTRKDKSGENSVVCTCKCGCTIEVIVTEAKNPNRVRLGFIADKSISILRKEIIQDEEAGNESK